MEYVVIGGFAVGARGFPRATKDLDIVLAPDAIEVPFRGATVRICSLAHLRLIKETAGRPQDLVDLENLPAG